MGIKRKCGNQYLSFEEYSNCKEEIYIEMSYTDTNAKTYQLHVIYCAGCD